MASLNSEQMIIVAEVFNDAYNHLINNLHGDAKKAAIDLTSTIVLRERPYMLLTTEGLQHITEMVFGNEYYRDFILSLTYHFYARYGGTGEDLLGLCINIARGAGQVARVNTMSLIPSQIADRLSEEEPIIELLVSNKWITTVMFISLFISISIEQKPSKK